MPVASLLQVLAVLFLTIMNVALQLQVKQDEKSSMAMTGFTFGIHFLFHLICISPAANSIPMFGVWMYDGQAKCSLLDSPRLFLSMMLQWI